MVSKKNQNAQYTIIALLNSKYYVTPKIVFCVVWIFVNFEVSYLQNFEDNLVWEGTCSNCDSRRLSFQVSQRC